MGTDRVDWIFYIGCVQAGFPYALAAIVIAASIIAVLVAVRGALPMPRRGRHRAVAPVVEGDHDDAPTLALFTLRRALAPVLVPGARALVQQADRKAGEL